MEISKDNQAQVIDTINNFLGAENDLQQAMLINTDDALFKIIEEFCKRNDSTLIDAKNAEYCIFNGHGFLDVPMDTSVLKPEDKQAIIKQFFADEEIMHDFEVEIDAVVKSSKDSELKLVFGDKSMYTRLPDDLQQILSEHVMEALGLDVKNPIISKMFDSIIALNFQEEEFAKFYDEQHKNLGKLFDSYLDSIQSLLDVVEKNPKAKDVIQASFKQFESKISDLIAESEKAAEATTEKAEKVEKSQEEQQKSMEKSIDESKDIPDDQKDKTKEAVAFLMSHKKEAFKELAGNLIESIRTSIRTSVSLHYEATKKLFSDLFKIVSAPVKKVLDAGIEAVKSIQEKAGETVENIQTYTKEAAEAFKKNVISLDNNVAYALSSEKEANAYTDIFRCAAYLIDNPNMKSPLPRVNEAIANFITNVVAPVIAKVFYEPEIADRITSELKIANDIRAFERLLVEQEMKVQGYDSEIVYIDKKIKKLDKAIDKAEAKIDNYADSIQQVVTEIADSLAKCDYEITSKKVKGSEINTGEDLSLISGASSEILTAIRGSIKALQEARESCLESMDTHAENGEYEKVVDIKIQMADIDKEIARLSKAETKIEKTFNKMTNVASGLISSKKSDIQLGIDRKQAQRNIESGDKVANEWGKRIQGEKDKLNQSREDAEKGFKEDRNQHREKRKNAERDDR